MYIYVYIYIDICFNNYVGARLQKESAGCVIVRGAIHRGFIYEGDTSTNSHGINPRLAVYA